MIPLPEGKALNGFVDEIENRLILSVDRTVVILTYPEPCSSHVHANCSGRGTCGYGGACECDEGWQGNDCSRRELIFTSNL